MCVQGEEGGIQGALAGGEVLQHRQMEKMPGESPWREAPTPCPALELAKPVAQPTAAAIPAAVGRGDAVISSSSDSLILKCDSECKKNYISQFPLQPRGISNWKI